MSSIRKTEVTCILCGKPSVQTLLTSTNQFGSPDLDLRPSEMARSTMLWWVQECPHCGYVAKDLSCKSFISQAFLEKEEYRSCDHKSFKTSLAKTFYRDYLINREIGSTNAAFQSALRAAWACDDVNDTENAIFCRLMALAELEELIYDSHSETAMVMKADLLRRTGQFDVLLEEYKDKTFLEDISNQIIAFQMKKAKEKDVGCYTVADVTQPKE